MPSPAPEGEQLPGVALRLPRMGFSSGMEPQLCSLHCLVVGTPCLWGRKVSPQTMPSRAGVSGWQVVSVGCLCGLGSRNQLAPFHNRPRLSKMSASWGRGGGEPGKLLTREMLMLGRGRHRPRLPDSYFGMCCNRAQPWQGRGLYVGALDWRSARSKGEEVFEREGEGSGALPLSSDLSP